MSKSRFLVAEELILKYCVGAVPFLNASINAPFVLLRARRPVEGSIRAQSMSAGSAKSKIGCPSSAPFMKFVHIGQAITPPVTLSPNVIERSS